MRSFYQNLLSQTEVLQDTYGSILEEKSVHRVAFFAWEAIWAKILTLSNLRKQDRDIVNACPMCLQEDESPN